MDRKLARRFLTVATPFVISLGLMLSGIVSDGTAAELAKPFDAGKAGAPAPQQLQEQIKAQAEDFRLLDRWVMERGEPQTVTHYRKGLELVSALNKQGLAEIEQAMAWEVSTPVFTPLWLRYVGLIKALHAFEQEAQFVERLTREFPNSPQAIAAASARGAALQQYRSMQEGLKKIDRALELEKGNVLARILRASLLAQMPGKLSQAMAAFEEIKRESATNPSLMRLVAVYQQKTHIASGQPIQTGAIESEMVVAFLPERLDLQIREMAPQAWHAIQRGTGADALTELEKTLEAEVKNPVNFGVVLARYLEIARNIGQSPRAGAFCGQLAEKYSQSPQAQAALGYTIVTVKAETVMAETLRQIDKAWARDPSNFFVRIARITHLAHAPGRAEDARRELEQMKETERYELAALDSLIKPAETVSLVAPVSQKN